MADVTVPRPADGSPKVIVGSLVAGEKILGDPASEWQRQVIEEFSDAVAIDMESVGVARAVHEARTAVDYNPRFLVVRGISDLVRVATEPLPEGSTRDNVEERARWKPYAACVAAVFTRAVARLFLVTADRRREHPRGA